MFRCGCHCYVEKQPELQHHSSDSDTNSNAVRSLATRGQLMISGVAAAVPILLAYFTLRLAQAFMPNRENIYIVLKHLVVQGNDVFYCMKAPK